MGYRCYSHYSYYSPYSHYCSYSSYSSYSHSAKKINLSICFAFHSVCTNLCPTKSE